jgi:hypothetical protein
VQVAHEFPDLSSSLNASNKSAGFPRTLTSILHGTPFTASDFSANFNPEDSPIA